MQANTGNGRGSRDADRVLERGACHLPRLSPGTLNLSEPRESRQTSQAYATMEEKNENGNFADTTPIVKQDYIANVFSSCLR